MSESRHHLHPTYGFTKLGLAVHRRTVDHLPANTAYQRFNKRVALMLTQGVGTMTCFWIFFLLSLTVLPSVLYQMNVISKHTLIPAYMITFGFELLTTWLFSTCLQLILLPGLMVGQNLQNEAADARAAKTFEDVEDARESLKRALDLLDCHTAGGLRTILDAVESLKGELTTQS